MKSRLYNITKMSIFIIIVMFGIWSISSILEYKQKEKNDNNRITISGTCTINDNSIVPIEKNMNFTNDKIYKIILKGNLEKEISKDKRIVMYMKNLYVTVKINNKVYFESKERNENLLLSKYPLYAWDSFISDGISKNDIIEIQIKNMNKSKPDNSISEFLNNFQCEDEYEIYKEMIDRNLIEIVIGIIAVSIGIIGTAVVIILGKTKVIRIKDVIGYSMFSFWGGLCFLIVGNSKYINLIISNYQFICILQIIIILFFQISFSMLMYTNYKRQKNKNIILVATSIMAVLIIVYLLIKVFRNKYLYQLSICAVIWESVFIICSIYTLVNEIYLEKDTMKIKILISFIPIIVGIIINNANYYMNINLNLSLSCIGYGIVISIFSQFYLLIKFLRIDAALKIDAENLEKQLMEMKMKAMISQMQPHFIFNSLLAIKQLCETQPKKASEAVEHFSFYLRENIDYLQNKKYISFKKEMEHVKNYIYFEKIRFEDRINVIYDIKIQDFLIPPLTLQPIVENAVRHGITKKREGGIIKISTYMEKDKIIIKIEDNGIGFNINKIAEDGGINNIRNRIINNCNGTFTVKSKIKAGTIVKIIIPVLKSI